MTYISIKLLALAVIYGCSLLAFTIADGDKEFVGFFVLLVIAKGSLLVLLGRALERLQDKQRVLSSCNASH